MITTSNLTKYFGSLGAVQSVNLSVDKGEVFGLLGPNGAGKTTTIRMLTTLLSPSSGTAIGRGLTTSHADPMRVKRSIGVVPQMLNLDIDLTCAENLEYHGRLHRMEAAGPDSAHRGTAAVRGALGKEGYGSWSIFPAACGRRLLIARGLMHRPQVVFMDEPTVGLDPQARRLIWGLIESLKQSGITIMLTTHYIEEADALCDRVAIMRTGKIIALDCAGGAQGAGGQVFPRMHRQAGPAAAVLSRPGKRRTKRAGARPATSWCASRPSRTCSSA